MNTLALYAQSQALASSQEKTTVAENTVSATAQSNNLGIAALPLPRQPPIPVEPAAHRRRQRPRKRPRSTRF